MAVGAIAADLGVAVIVFPAAIGNLNGNQAAALAVGAGAAFHVFGGMKGEAIAAELVASLGISPCWEEVLEIGVTGEISAVERLQVAGAIELVAALVDHGGGPAGGSAIAAMHHGQMGAGF